MEFDRIAVGGSRDRRYIVCQCGKAIDRPLNNLVVTPPRDYPSFFHLPPLFASSPINIPTTMSPAAAASQANKLSPEFPKQVRSTTTLLLNLFAQYKATLTNNSIHEDTTTPEMDLYNNTVRNFF
jgi:hypothetical protein